MRTIALLTILLLVGCGGSVDESDNNHGYGYSYDFRGDSGLALRYSPSLLAEKPFPWMTLLEKEYLNVQECVGISAPPPMVIVVNDGDLKPYGGLYYPDPDLIVVEHSSLQLAFKHEVVHYLLHYGTGNLDPAHNSELFVRCSFAHP